MKIINKLFIGFLNFILIDLILILILNCTLQDFLFNDVLITGLKSTNNLSNEEYDIQTIQQDIPIVANTSILEEAMNDEEIKELVDNFIEEILINIW